MILAAFVVVLVSLAAAGEVQFYDEDIGRAYQAGEALRGTVNLSFANVSSQAVLSSSFVGNISLLDWLEGQGLVESVDFSCSTVACARDYTQGAAVTNLNLPVDSEKTVGFKLTGDEVSVRSLQFRVRGNSGPSCVRPFLLDALNRQEFFLQQSASTEVACETVDRGCFDGELLDAQYQLAELTSNPYCENVTLAPAPSYRVGAKVTNSSLTSDMTMSLYDADFNFFGSCVLPRHTTDVEELGCVVDRPLLHQGSYFVCVQGNLPESGYQIRFEQSGERCGTDNFDTSQLDRDYDVFVQAMQFDFLDLGVNESSFFTSHGVGLVDTLNAYLDSQYNRDCTGSEGCLLPFRFVSKAQDLLFMEVEAKYTSGATLLTAPGTMFLLEEEEATLSSESLELDLSSTNFTAPSGKNITKFDLYLDGESVLNASVAMTITQGFTFEMTPNFALLGLPTNFTLEYAGAVRNVKWDFGDGQSETTLTKGVTHAYAEEGTYDVTVVVTRNDSVQGKKTFTILVGDAEESARTLLERYDARLINLTGDILSVPSWARRVVDDQLDLITLNATLTQHHQEFRTANATGAYASLVSKLLQLNVPQSIQKSSSGSFPLVTGFGELDPELVLEVSGQKDGDSEELKAAITQWFGESYDGTISFDVFSQFDDGGRDDLVTVFKVDVKPETSDAAFLFLGYPVDALMFAEAYGEKAIKSGAMISLPAGGGAKSFSFAVGRNVGVTELAAYVSPEVNRLGMTKFAVEGQKRYPVWTVVLLVVGVLVVLFIAYLFLARWYRHSYEGRLFANRQDLSNMLSFIHRSRKSGSDDSVIKKGLGGLKWTGEQVSYAFKKLDGGRVGLPLSGLFEGRKVRKEMEKGSAGRGAVGKVLRPVRRR